jgi:hypothetical protein
VDLKQVLTVSDLAGGYFDAGIVEGKNKLQPSLSFRIGRNGDRPRTISLNVHFRKIVGTEMEEWDEVFLQTVEFAEGSRTALITARTQAGYTGDPPQSRAGCCRIPSSRTCAPSSSQGRVRPTGSSSRGTTCRARS